LEIRANGDVYDKYGIYGVDYVVYGRIVDGVTAPVAEGLFVESSNKEDSDKEDYL